MSTTIYPDTAAGAAKALLEMSTIDLSNAVYTPDPHVAGVWLVQTATDRAVVYLAGYPDPWRQVRTENDFEAQDA